MSSRLAWWAQWARHSLDCRRPVTAGMGGLFSCYKPLCYHHLKDGAGWQLMLAKCLLGGRYFTKSFIYSLTDQRSKGVCPLRSPGLATKPQQQLQLQNPQVSSTLLQNPSFKKYRIHWTYLWATVWHFNVCPWSAMIRSGWLACLLCGTFIPFPFLSLPLSFPPEEGIKRFPFLFHLCCLVELLLPPRASSFSSYISTCSHFFSSVSQWLRNLKSGWLRQSLSRGVTLNMPLHVFLPPLYPLSEWQGCLLASFHRIIASMVCQSARKTVYSEWSQLFSVFHVTSRSPHSHKDNLMPAVFISAKSSLVFASTWPHFLDGSFRCCRRCFGSQVPRPWPTCPVHRGSVPLKMPQSLTPLSFLGSCSNSRKSVGSDSQ